ncbi:organomercurial transporter MerC [Pleionea mediterranea]|uniref:Mercuric ion transport protein n=1 Tax=Pleionea mediterranea TaxID=523701 RepID=A0A316FGE3_9GAMM|nr:organomercurial transporter MerC [Pleionea mediterranea]PWK47313.1 mercuric ion transport protein [Pleionea mediterranea]
MVNKLVDKLGIFGVWLAALSCTACFPALGTVASLLGLGFLSSLEGIAINYLLPILALVVLLANSLSWYNNRQHIRGVLGVSGPLAILTTLYLFWSAHWSTYLFYLGLSLMLLTSIIDMYRWFNKT